MIFSGFIKLWKFRVNLIIIIFSFISLYPAHAQGTSALFAKGLNINFDASEMKKLQKAEKLISDADALLQNAKNQFGTLSELAIKQRFSSEYVSALKMLFESSEMSKDAYNIAFGVLRQKSESFWLKMSRENHHAAGMDKARYYESSALKTLNASIIRRNQALESDRFEYSLEIMEDAVELEKLALRDQGRAVQICLDFPVEYDYKWDDDPTLEEIVKLTQDPIVHEPPKDIFATVDEKAPIDSTLLKEIIFKVQIAAHTKTLTNEYLNLIYKGSLPVDMIFEDEWYKYSIGRYKTFEEAEATRADCDIKKAFVVAYREGKKIPAQEALHIIEQRKSAGLPSAN
jgi:hypothetical protein